MDVIELDTERDCTGTAYRTKRATQTAGTRTHARSWGPGRKTERQNLISPQTTGGGTLASYFSSDCLGPINHAVSNVTQDIIFFSPLIWTFALWRRRKNATKGRKESNCVEKGGEEGVGQGRGWEGGGPVSSKRMGRRWGLGGGGFGSERENKIPATVWNLLKYEFHISWDCAKAILRSLLFPSEWWMVVFPRQTQTERSCSNRQIPNANFTNREIWGWIRRQLDCESGGRLLLPPIFCCSKATPAGLFFDSPPFLLLL